MKIFKVINSGLLTTVQDLGREGFQKYGLAVSGSADHYAHRMANILVSNREDCAVLEVTLMGLKMKALQSTVIAVTGGDLEPTVNGQSVPMWASIRIQEGDTIHFKGCRSGCRAYLAVAGGIDVPLVLGSRSTDTVGKIGGFGGRGLEKGDVIEACGITDPLYKRSGRRLPPSLIPEYSDNIKARVIPGPQKEAFTRDALETFFSSVYTVTKDLDRMACRLDGPELEHREGAGILSEGIFWGAVQVPKNGKPIVFLVGRQSVGGYTKIGGVISADLPKLAQAKPGDSIHFEEVGLNEAHQRLKAQEKMFNILRSNVT